MKQVPEKPRFNIEKTTEATAYMLQLCGPEKPVKFMKILKLLYLADREALREWERPITYDSYCSMDQGQVMSNTYDLMKRELRSDEWDEYIQHKLYYWLVLKKPPQPQKLSRAETDLLKRIFDEFGELDEFELADLTHKLPEYKETNGSSIPTALDELLSFLEFTEDDIQRVNKHLGEQAILDGIFAG